MGATNSKADHLTLGNVKVAQGDLAAAEACYREALRLDPGCAIAHRNLGRVKFAQGDLAAAEACLREALRLDGCAVAHCNLGLVKFAQGDLAAAEACFREALRLDAGYALAHCSLGYFLLLRGDTEGARGSLNEALRLDPKFASALAVRGLLKFRSYEFDGAKADLDTAISLQGNAFQFEVRGRLKAEMEQWASALQDYNEALQRSQGQPVLLQRRAALKLKLEQRDGARDDLRACHCSTEASWLYKDGWLIPPLDAKKSFLFSPFALEYEVALRPTSLQALKDLARELVRLDGNDDWMSFSARLLEEMDRHPDDAVQDAMERLWTSAMENSKGIEFCSILSACVRFDPSTLDQALCVAPIAAPLARALNANLVLNRCVAGEVFFPPGGRTLRGSSLPNQHIEFFKAHEGKKIRMPSYWATAVEQEPHNHVSCQFMQRAVESGRPPALWTVEYDERGDPNNANYDKKFVCKHVNLIKKRVDGLPDEHEYLFVAFSVFTIKEVTPSSSPTVDDPHRLTVIAAIDNRGEPEDLPLAPWG